MKLFMFLVVFLTVYDWNEGCGQRPLVAPPGNSEPMTWADSEEGAWPWQISIQLDDDVVCGGTIVHPEFVLTAAYCYSLMTSIERYRVVAGVTVRSQIDHRQIRNITKLRQHHNYNSMNSEYDVMLVRLDSPFNFTNYVQPICLVYHSVVYDQCFISGWKRFISGTYLEPVLQYTEVSQLFRDSCEGYIEASLLSENKLCGGLMAGQVNDTSQSDLGGPLQCYSPQYLRFYQLGVGSFGPWYGQINIPGVYAAPSTFSVWIQEMLTVDETLQTVCAGSKSSTSLVPVLLSAVLLLLHVWQ